MRRIDLKKVQLRMERRRLRRKRANDLKRRGIVSTGSINFKEDNGRPKLIIRFQ